MSIQTNSLKLFSVLTIVVNDGQASRVLKDAKACGISGGTVFFARGTSNNIVLKLLDLCDKNMEVVVMLAERSKIMCAMQALNDKYRFTKPHHGFAFCVPVVAITGIHACEGMCMDPTKGEPNMKHHAIYTIVDRGYAQDVVEAARKAGARGGTIIQGRGSGIHESETFFSMAIEPEKEIVLVVADAQHTENIVASIRKELHIDEPGKGIVFVQPVEHVIGFTDTENMNRPTT